MLHFTLIVRQRDALALAADTDTCSSELEQCKVAAKTLLRKLAVEHSNPSVYVPPFLTIVWKNYMFHILFESDVSFLTMCDPATPANMAFAFLEDVAQEFLQQYGPQVEAATRPYCFIKFDLYLQRTKKVFATASASRSMSMPRSGRPVPVRRTFDEVMAGGESKSGASGLSGRGKNSGVGTMQWALFAGALVVIALALGVIVYFVVLQ
ncbi:synaptobrevin-type transport protein [Trypanosoma grayi]|uniref:synaptobrevin-type transport protein n=1 Tax=Trypanosoma grayi TaxID=71804 RepID=UPI0004F4087C|nr:synaptobrevin-type transport protein [Trypanosoma grayi]KEG14174.1 synaptobrevin-type transport protein [Trypanosoma grayi]